ncbi:MAG: hypothetical protein DME26_10990 [Verrucomicrobia bacterium]|nr:MAG: hypothetical protein DME26_10990 [Verrucomicrobiota bacterium]
MTNAERILETLDNRLDHEVSLVVYGRAAIALGFENPPEAVTKTLDVDAVIPLSESARFRADLNFWDAQEGTNRELQKEGLYITHLFEADQVFLRRDWEQYLVSITRPSTRWLKLFRPATLDLILTKMMRGDDPQDMADIAFMVRHDQTTAERIENAFVEAVIPDLVELRDAFERAKPRVREIVRQGGAEQ